MNNIKLTVVVLGVIILIGMLAICILQSKNSLVEYSTTNPFPGRTIGNGFPVGEGKCVYPLGRLTELEELLLKRSDNSTFSTPGLILDFTQERSKWWKFYQEIQNDKDFKNLEVKLSNFSVEGDLATGDFAIEKLQYWESMSNDNKVSFLKDFVNILFKNIESSGINIKNTTISFNACDK
jgi:hypothetical protein